MWFTKQIDGFRGWLALKGPIGQLVTGAVPGDFSVTVVNPADSATVSPAVSESAAKPGLYSFLVPSSFFLTNGAGGYGIVVVVNKTTPPRVQDVLGEVLRVYLEDFDSVAAGQAAVPSAVWSEVIDGPVTAGEILARINAWVRGKVTMLTSVASYFAEDDSTLLFKNDVSSDTERLPA